MLPDPMLVALTRAVEKQSRFDADVAAALVRILRGDERGIARGRAHELRKLLTSANIEEPHP